jgi:hypothetical protein
VISVEHERINRQSVSLTALTVSALKSLRAGAYRRCCAVSTVEALGKAERLLAVAAEIALGALADLVHGAVSIVEAFLITLGIGS